jgi:methionyl-tRNA formyltransferase
MPRRSEYMPTQSKSTSSAKSLLFWCCRPLGLRTLEYFLSLPEYGRSFFIKGVVVSSRDPRIEDIISRATKEKIKVYRDNDKLSEPYDLGYCTGFSYKITKETLRLCGGEVFNLHFAILPDYRGSGTLTHAIINEEPRYGVTLHLMEETLDTGPIVAIKTYPLPKDKTAQQITDDVEQLGYDVITKHFASLLNHTYTLTSQSDIIEKTGVHPRFCTRKSVDNLYKLDPEWDFEKVYKYMRALTLGKPKKPFFEKSGKKIYLSLSE